MTLCHILPVIERLGKYIYTFFIIQHVKACMIPCPHQPLTRSDNTVSVAQVSTTTPGTTKQLLPPDRVFKIYIYIYIYMPDQLKGEITVYIHLHFLCSLWFLKRVYFWPWMSLCARSNHFLMLHNHTGMVIPCAFHSCWKPFALQRQIYIILQKDVICWSMGPLR